MPAPLRSSGPVPSVRPSQSLPVAQRSAATAGTAAAATGFANQSTFDSAEVQQAKQSADKMIHNGDNPLQSKRWETTIGEQRLAALTNPAKAADMLKNGVRDPDTGQVLRVPPDPNSPFGQMLTKVANGQPITPQELSNEMTSVAGQAWADKRIMDKAMDDFEKMADEAKKKVEEAIKKGDVGAVK
jgi:hypothetical protein